MRARFAADQRGDLLDRLANWAWWDLELWREIFFKSNLWDDLYDQVKSGRLSEKKKIFNWFHDFLDELKTRDPENISPQAEAHADIARWMAMAAVEAAGLERPNAAPSDINARLAYRDCVRGFDHSLCVGSRVRVPVAAAGSRPEILWLQLEAIADGTGIVRHPRDELERVIAELWVAPRQSTSYSFRDSNPSQFVSSTYRAFETAQMLAGERGRQGRWSFVHSNGIPVNVEDTDTEFREADGSSASGAAVLGWYRCLTGAIYDSRVIVIAALDHRRDSEEPRLTHVENRDIATKIEAILDASRKGELKIDKIGVVRENCQAAQDALPGSGEIQIVELEKTITQPASSRI
jgi:hypothetical protein